MSQHDDHDDLSALDFSSYGSGSDGDGVEESAALDFSHGDGDGHEQSGVDALQEFAPTAPAEEEAGADLEAIDSATQAAEDEEDDELEGFHPITVTNPPETVTVSALLDGRTYRVHLSAKATNMTETELADEILVIADLARQKGLASQRSFLVENDELSEGMHEMGIDNTGEFVNEFIDQILDLPTEEQADAAQAEVFATRYADK